MFFKNVAVALEFRSFTIDWEDGALKVKNSYSAKEVVLQVSTVF